MENNNLDLNKIESNNTNLNKSKNEGETRTILALIAGVSGMLISTYFILSFSDNSNNLIQSPYFWWFFLYDLINSTILFLTFFIKRKWFLKISFFVFLIGFIPPLLFYRILGIIFLISSLYSLFFINLFLLCFFFFFVSIWNYIYLLRNWKEDKKLNTIKTENVENKKIYFLKNIPIWQKVLFLISAFGLLFFLILFFMISNI